MAKKPPETVPTAGRRDTEPDEADGLLIELATALLAEYFFNPDNEARYRQLTSARKASSGKPPASLRSDPPIFGEGIGSGAHAIRWQLDALANRNGVRVTLTHRNFSAAIEGAWQFQREALRSPRVADRRGTSRAIIKAAEALMDEMFVPFIPSDQELEGLLAALADDREDRHSDGHNPEEPPPADLNDRARLKKIVDERTRKPQSELRADDRSWLELTPQILPVLTEMTVQSMAAIPRPEGRVAACLNLLTQELEFVRYRLERGWDWASRMLEDYQQRLIDLGHEEALDQQDWFAMAAALAEARVPVSDEIQQALAEAGMTIADPAPPEELLAALRDVSAEMASLVTSPFEVLEALSSAGAVMPAALRSFMATELSLSPHAVLREAVPQMLLDADPSVRRSAGQAMAQIAGAETVSPDWLRRAITLRNWIPQGDRAAVDSAIHKARASGVPIGIWPGTQPAAAHLGRQDVSFHASLVDGSGAQTILAVSRTGRMGLVAGLLLKHGVGVTDAWVDTETPRRVINGMLKELKSTVVCDEVERHYVDTVVQQAIAAGLAHGKVPGQKLLEIAEGTVSPNWRDHSLDIAGEAEAMFASLPLEERTPDARLKAAQRILAWMSKHEVSQSWFEDHQSVHRLIATVPPSDRATAVQRVLDEVLATTRTAWAERFLLIAMWCSAAASLTHRNWTSDFIILAQSVAGSEPLDTIPVMVRIAEQTVLSARSTGW